jgi:hypothetical protein
MKFRNPSRVEIKSEEFCQFRDSEWTGSHGDALEETLHEFPVSVIDLSQRPFICPIECRGQFVQGIPDTPWEALA